MNKTFERSLEFVKRWEGIDSDDPHDTGGRTRFGISQNAHPDVDVPNLTWGQAKEIYRIRYYGAAGCERCPPDVAFALFDAAVQHGVKRAIRMLQEGIGVKADGIFGPITEAATRKDGAALEMMARRARFYAVILDGNLTQWRFAGGWFRRLIHAVDYLREVN